METVEPEIVVLYGGVGGEREVSLRSGAILLGALRKRFRARGVELTEATIPENLDPRREVVFPALHGLFGEDGGVQSLLAANGVHYAGSNAESSRLCMNKQAVKVRAAAEGLPVACGWHLEAGACVDDLLAGIADFGPEFVVKPNEGGSSVGMHFLTGASAVAQWWKDSDRKGSWLVEERVVGRELTVGILNGKAAGIVEIITQQGVYDYEAKYTPGHSRYEYPARLGLETERGIKADAERLFALCGCRDFARVDFLLSGDCWVILEINTIPGLTQTSLLPKSASCLGLDFDAVAEAMVRPCLERWRQRVSTEAVGSES